ncbi:hypothetical protein DEO72_LG10g1935 [Vigna unguiculata]|uniref:Uncharacterized protein n=1 Tax=Vigna unguiculata TaxID=3917 RepID=A0A4D6ND77_VIGUN|nr:hypothetical protein DEO72_LG10g1935 [Vigna unguiculata]
MCPLDPTRPTVDHPQPLERSECRPNLIRCCYDPLSAPTATVGEARTTNLIEPKPPRPVATRSRWRAQNDGVTAATSVHAVSSED